MQAGHQQQSPAYYDEHYATMRQILLSHELLSSCRLRILGPPFTKTHTFSKKNFSSKYHAVALLGQYTFRL